MERQMKDSGLPWIGTIPCQWSTKPNKYVMHKIKEIQDIYKGENILSLSTDGVKVRDLDAGGKMPSSFNGYQRVKPGNLLMCLFDIDVTPRCIGLVKNEGLTSPAYSQFVLKEEAHAPYFYYYYLALDNDKTLVHLAKNLRHSLTEDQLGAISVIFPPFEEQQRIAAYLDSTTQKINEAIEQAKDLIEQYKAYKKSLISEAVIRGLDPTVEMHDSGIAWIGKIPMGWEIKRIKYILKERKEYSVFGTEEPLTMSQRHGIIPTKDYGEIAHAAATFVGAKIVYPQDLVFNKLKAHLGVFSVSQYNGVVSPDYAVYYTHSACVKYLEYLFKTSIYINEFRKRITGVGAGLSRLYTSDLYSMPSVFPPREVQEQIVVYLDRKCSIIDRLIEEKEALITRLQSYRKSVIYEYVTGKKQVPQ